MEGKEAIVIFSCNKGCCRLQVSGARQMACVRGLVAKVSVTSNTPGFLNYRHEVTGTKKENVNHPKEPATSNQQPATCNQSVLTYYPQEHLSANHSGAYC